MSGFERETNRFQRGFRQILIEVIAGIVISSILGVLIETSTSYVASYMLLVRLATAISTLIFVFFIPFFGTAYTIGWLLGLALMSYSGLVKPYDYLFYLIPLILGWLLRLLRR